jgi:2-dehydrotetronate isomerase
VQIPTVAIFAMPQFAANLTMMYTEYSFLDRFEAAARDGFRAVEMLFPYAYPTHELQTRLQANGLQLALFNAPAGGASDTTVDSAWAHGQRGTACLAGREEEFRFGLARALHYATALQCPRIHIMAGLVPAGANAATLQATYVANLQYAAHEAAKVGVALMIEPINTRDMPGYYLHMQEHAHATLQAVGAPNLQLQMDLYHCQIMQGDVATRLRASVAAGIVGHIQIAGVPERHEPDTGELNYPYLLDLLDTLGYSGWVGCEYRPRRGSVPHATRDGLAWRQSLCDLPV